MLLEIFKWAPLLVLLASCQSSSKKSPQELQPPKDYVPATTVPLTDVGINNSPFASADGSRILFISSGRLQHNQPQAYELDLKTKVMHRLTYQDGDVAEAAYNTSGDQFFYTSSTDESKENPQIIKNLKSKLETGAPSVTTEKNILGQALLPTEIYYSSMAGDDIHRLTTHEGFDGLFALRPKITELVYVNFKDGKARMQVMNYQTGATWPIGTAAEMIDKPSFSPDGKSLVWVQKNANFVELMVGDARAQKPHRLIDKTTAIYLHPQWSPDGKEILFSANLDGPKNFELYSVMADGTCLRRLTYNASQGFIKSTE